MIRNFNKYLFSLKKNNPHYSILIYVWLAVQGAFGFAGCASHRQFVPPPPIPGDMHDIPQPQPQSVNVLADGFKRQIIDQGAQSVDLARQWRNITNTRKQALNVDAFDRVTNSSWFTNRIGDRSRWNEDFFEEFVSGPCNGDGPDTSDVLTIIRAKSQGMAPGFWIQDRQGDTYIVKFDSKGLPESATGTEVVVTKIMWACGYNVPENYVFYFHPEMLELGENVKFTDEKGRKRSMTTQDLEDILNKVERREDGYFRAHASKLLPGKPLGHFNWKSVRKDDPNDFVPHQHRRELRALRVINAWVNNYDTNSGNVFDTFVNEDYNSFVRHYLIDFSGAMGSYIFGPMPPTRGKENYFDPHRISYNIATLGLHVHDWEKNWVKYTPVKFSSVGYFISEDFNPHEFKFTFPNEAFENMTNRDSYWAAKIVMSFSDELLGDIVHTGKYSDSEAEEYMVQTLAERRDIVGKYYFNRINCLDHFEIQHNNRQFFLKFTDMMLFHDLQPANSAQYRYSIRLDGLPLVLLTEIGTKDMILLPQIQATNEFGQWCVMIQIKRDGQDEWGKWVNVYLEVDKTNNVPMIIGVQRQE